MTAATLALAGGLCLGLAVSASAHDGKKHATVAEARSHAVATSAAVSGPNTPFPLKLGGTFTLTDHTGAVRTEADPAGRLQLVFFGYANCQAICSVALPLMADITDTVAADGVALAPVMITVDPERDTVATMAAPLAHHHEAYVGLTGSEAELAPVYDLFSVERSMLFEDPEYGPIYAHGSHIYLMDGTGAFLTLIPPILSADRAAEIVLSYATATDD